MIYGLAFALLYYGCSELYEAVGLVITMGVCDAAIFSTLWPGIS